MRYVNNRSKNDRVVIDCSCRHRKRDKVRAGFRNIIETIVQIMIQSQCGPIAVPKMNIII